MDEAAVLLNKPALKGVGEKFRESGRGWEAINLALLPDDVEPLCLTRELMLKQRQLFLEGGQATMAEREAISARLREIKREVSADFPLDAAGVQRLRENLADKVTAVHDIEYEAVMMLQEAMG